MSAEVNSHEEWLERAALFAIDALSGEERRVFADHLATCSECQREVASFGSVGVALAQAVPQLDPPPALKARVLTAALGSAPEVVRPVVHDVPDRSPQHWNWMPLAAALVLAVGLGAYAYSLRGRVTSLEAELGVAQQEAASSLAQTEAARRTALAAQQQLDVLTAADAARVQLASSSPGAPAPASGRADWSRSRGLSVSVDNLPPAAPGRTYQVWYLTGGMPVSAGLLRPDASGRLTGTYPIAAGVQDPIGFALTEEPDSGSPQPTTQPVLVGLLARAETAPRP